MESVSTIELDLAVQAKDRYVKVPFTLPTDARSFEVILEGTEGVEGLCVDLGCEGPSGMRGWSGGARKWFVIRDDDATPGYQPGPLEPGTWNVILGVHTVPAGGATATVRVVSPAVGTVDHGPVPDPQPRLVRGSDRDLPAPDGLHWFAGDMHSHSLHSDGELSLWELANEAIASGLDFLGSTDHNTVSHHAHLASVGARQGITLLPGQEVTTHRGHANAYGRIGFIDFRTPGEGWAREVDSRGGMLSINHPVSGDCSWLYKLEEAPRSVELFHGSQYGQPIDTAPLAWFRHLAAEDSIVLGGSDFHNRSTGLRPGMPTTWIAARDSSEEALLEGLFAGRTTMTGKVTYTDGVGRPDLMETPILIRFGEELRVLLGGGLVLVDGAGRRLVISADDQQVPAPVAEGPYRLETAERHWMAMSR